jgi:hypothetical protein
MIRQLLTVLAVALLLAEPAFAVQWTRAEIERREQQARRVGLTPEQAAEVYQFIDQNLDRIDAAAAERGVNRNAFRAIARELGLRNYGADPQQLLVAIRERTTQAATFERQKGELEQRIRELENAALRTPAEAALQRANAAYQDGDLDTAQTELESLITLRSGELSSNSLAWNAAHRAAINLAQSRDDIAAIDRITAQAIELRTNRATLDREESWYDQMARAEARHRRGALLGDNAAMLAAIAIYRDEALPLTAEMASLNFWASTQLALGNSQLILGRRESSPEIVRQGISTYQQVIDRAPGTLPITYWANAHWSLGMAHINIGERSDSTTDFDLALAAFDQALTFYNRKNYRSQWSSIQLEILKTLVLIDARRRDTRSIQLVGTRAQSLLGQISNERGSELWSSTQQTLCVIHTSLGKNANDRGLLVQAVSECELAVGAISREDRPLDWASAQSALGYALEELGTMESDIATLERALMAHNWSLEERTSERGDRDHARSLINSARTTALIADRSANPRLLAQAWENVHIGRQFAARGGDGLTFDRANWTAYRIHEVATRHGWTLPDMQESGGLPGTAP